MKRVSPWDVPPSKRPWDIAPGRDESDDDEVQVHPGQRMVDELLESYLEGTLSAKKFCVVCYHAFHAGVEEARPYAFRPGAEETGHYQRKLDSALNFKADDDKLYSVDVPLTIHGERRKSSMLVRLPHECLQEQLQNDPTVLTDWEANIQNETWVRAYEQHPLVRGASREDRRRVLPIALYMDSTEFQTQDSLVVLTVHFLPSNTRHLIWAARKSSLCACGCAGWCSFFPLFQVVSWSLAALRLGVHPASRHDGRVWRDSDALRKSKSRASLGIKGVVIDIQGDWAEFAHRWGFPTWKSSTSPCFLCNCTGVQLREGTGDLTERTTDDFLRECNKCEKWVMVEDRRMHARIRFALENDPARKGRVLTVGIEELGLQQGDRLEPSGDLPDVFDFDTLPLPALVLFWQIPAAPVVHRRHPLLNPELGIGLHTFSIDVLHTLHLGVFQEWNARAMWSLLECDVFQIGHAIMHVRIKESLGAVEARLKEWYFIYERTLSEEEARGMTRVRHLKPSMIGSAAKPRMKLKAAETRHFVPFLLQLVKEYAARLAECGVVVGALIGAGQSLIDYTAILNEQPRQVSPDAYNDLLRLCREHNEYARRAGVAPKPKHHLFRHLTERVQEHGNPRFYSTYHDESLNRQLARVAASCHRMTFERRLFSKFSRSHGLKHARSGSWW